MSEPGTQAGSEMSQLSDQQETHEVSPLLSQLRIGAVEEMFDAYAEAGTPIRDSIDGGSGAGRLSKKMMERSTGTVFAFEPFPGNHRFYTEDLDRIRLFKAALADEPGKKSFFVGSTVEADSKWAKERGLEGYSSVGYLVDEELAAKRQEQKPEGQVLTVHCVAADERLPIARPIDVVKLDLQGGELDALKGMQRIARRAQFLWIEYTGQFGLAKHLWRKRFTLFDTLYMFRGKPTDAIRERFEITNDAFTLTSGATTCFGYPKEPIEGDYEEAFREMKKSLNLIQTDIVAVHANQLETFLGVVDRLRR